MSVPDLMLTLPAPPCSVKQPGSNRLHGVSYLTAGWSSFDAIDSQFAES